jgi:inner membrane protein
MTGKTHIAVGITAALAFVQPRNIKDIMLCIGVSAVGSVISDIDVTTSESRKGVDRVIGITVLVVILIVIIEFNWKFGIISYITNNSDLYDLLIGVAIFLCVCIFGKKQPHRSFMHSISAVFILSSIIYFVLPMVVPFFAIAMLSHIIIDMLNYTNVKILYPLKWGISLDICHADGIVSKFLCTIGIVSTIVLVIYLIV